MGKKLIEQMVSSLVRIPLPDNKVATIQGKQTYDIGLEKVDEYKRDPKILAAALRIFQTCDSQPYIFAGVAYTLLTAARESDDSYAQIGLDEAMEWLEKAQEMAPDIVSINMIEAFIYIHSGRFDDARLVLDFLSNIEHDNLYLMRAEIAYWQGLEQVDEAIQWYEKAIAASDTVPRKLRLRNQMADCYLQFGYDDKALEIYEEAALFSKEDPWLWHNMSVAAYNKGEFVQAARHNKLALALLDFPDAREMERALRSKLGTGGLINKILGS